MASRKWNQIPGSMWWSIPSTSTLVRERDRSYSLDAPDSPRYTTDVRDRSFSLKFYEFAEEVQTEENLKEWLKGGDDRGVIRVFQPNSTYSDLIKCNATTTAELVVSKCVATELYIDHAGQSLELVPLTSNPLRLQERFLRSIGFKDPERIKLEGLKDNLSYMFKFIAGKCSTYYDEAQTLMMFVISRERAEQSRREGPASLPSQGQGAGTVWPLVQTILCPLRGKTVHILLQPAQRQAQHNTEPPRRRDQGSGAQKVLVLHPGRNR